MATRIFINYRRDDSIATAGRLHDRLVSAFGSKSIFMDVDRIPAGVDFVDYLNMQVSECDAFLTIIGPNWLNATDQSGRRRIDNPEDFVTVEIAAALSRNIRVIPVLVDGAQMPKANELPSVIKPLVRRNAVEVRNTQFGRDADALVTKVRDALRGERPTSRWWPYAAAAAVAALLLVGGIGLSQMGIVQWMPRGTQPNQGADRTEEARLKAEDDRRKVEAKRIAELKEAEAKRIAEEEARRKAEAEAKRIAEEEARRKAEAEAKRIAEEEARRKAEAEAKRIAEEEARRKAEAEAKRLAEEEARRRAEAAEAKRIAEEAARRKADETKRIAEQEEARRKTETEPKPKSDDGTRPTSALSVVPGSGLGFRDPLANGQPCPACLEMVVVPNGSFMMGSPQTEPERGRAENPQVKITITRPFAVARFAVTRIEFETFVKATGYQVADSCYLWTGKGVTSTRGASFRSPGFSQDDNHPAVCINWNDAQAYVSWLTKITGRDYHLLSEAQREYVTRASKTTPFWWGSSITPNQANYDGNKLYQGGGSQGEYRQRTVSVDAFAPNPWGLYNVHGNVWEWTADCWNQTNAGNPSDGRARTTGDCNRRVVRGGSWNNLPRVLRSAFRDSYVSRDRFNYQGFRVGRTLERTN